MPGSFKGSKPGSHLRRTRGRPDGPSRLAGLSAFREVMYTRMEEISFRASMTVLAGVVASAAVMAAVSTLMSIPPGPARHTALGRPPATAAPWFAPASFPSKPAPPTLAPALPSSSPASARPSRVRETGSGATQAPVTTVASVPSPNVPTPMVSPSPSRGSYQAAVAAWWAWWLRVYGGDARARSRRNFSGFGGDRGGFTAGGWFGRSGGWSGRR